MALRVGSNYHVYTYYYIYDTYYHIYYIYYIYYIYKYLWLRVIKKNYCRKCWSIFSNLTSLKSLNIYNNTNYFYRWYTFFWQKIHNYIWHKMFSMSTQEYVLPGKSNISKCLEKKSYINYIKKMFIYKIEFDCVTFISVPHVTRFNIQYSLINWEKAILYHGSTAHEWELMLRDERAGIKGFPWIAEDIHRLHRLT